MGRGTGERTSTDIDGPQAREVENITNSLVSKHGVGGSKQHRKVQLMGSTGEAFRPGLSMGQMPFPKYAYRNPESQGTAGFWQLV